MPFRNFHSARVRDPDLFVKDSIRTTQLGHGISVLSGKLKSDPNGSMVAQTYRFDSSKYSPEEAKNWMKKEGKKIILFEKAKPKKEGTSAEEDLKPTDNQDEDLKEGLLSKIFRKNRIVITEKPKPVRGGWFDSFYRRETIDEEKK